MYLRRSVTKLNKTSNIDNKIPRLYIKLCLVIELSA